MIFRSRPPRIHKITFTEPKTSYGEKTTCFVINLALSIQYNSILGRVVHLQIIAPGKEHKRYLIKN